MLAFAEDKCMVFIRNRLGFKALAFAAVFALAGAGISPVWAACLCELSPDAPCPMNQPVAAEGGCSCCVSTQSPAENGDNNGSDAVRARVCGCADTTPLSQSTVLDAAVPNPSVHKPYPPMIECDLSTTQPMPLNGFNVFAGRASAVVTASFPPHYLTVCSLLI